MNATIQDVLTYYHELGYSDEEIAEVGDVSQSTINRVRNGLISGNSLIQPLDMLIQDYQDKTGNTLMYSPHTNLGISSHSTHPTQETPIASIKSIASSIVLPLFTILIVIFILSRKRTIHLAHPSHVPSYQA